MSERGIVYRRAHDVLFREFGAEAVVARPDGDDVQILSGTGAAAWALLRDPRTARGLTADLADQFGVPSQQVGDDVEAFLEELAGLGLLEREGSSDA